MYLHFSQIIKPKINHYDKTNYQWERTKQKNVRTRDEPRAEAEEERTQGARAKHASSQEKYVVKRWRDSRL